ncbi:MAG TPA: tRNA (5-methylaminomethyl-2-thiouridine)(34)-methyltransferase MnmD [Puia sp.]|nr:tRNA (5-methylaminomethyl-2-thiouridine)(34)-methyltransferase MnmD [Puia sp.]
MTKRIIVTRDGSPSIEWREGVTYHSTFGALQESRHIFIDGGWKALTTGAHLSNGPLSDRSVADGSVQITASPLTIFELGLGTGLNALLTLLQAEAEKRQVMYEAIEPYPLEPALFEKLDYCARLGRPDLQPKFLQLHTSDWETPVSISPYFTFYRSRNPWPGHELRQPAELVYYDAFDPVVQPELWSAEAFRRLARQLAPGAWLLTYCSKGIVRRALQEAGFRVEKLPGPPGKREIVRAVLARSVS